MALKKFRARVAKAIKNTPRVMVDRNRIKWRATITTTSTSTSTTQTTSTSTTQTTSTSSTTYVEPIQNCICIDTEDTRLNNVTLTSILRYPEWRSLLYSYLASLGFKRCNCSEPSAEDGYGYGGY